VLDLAVTLAGALDGARRSLAEAGWAEPRLEAAELYSLLVCGPASAAWSDRERAISPSLAARIEAAVRLRCAGQPRQYAAGRACFRGHWLRVDGRVLIPRPETEGLVELVVEWAAGRCREAPAAPPPLVADIGTGSGAIAISLALEAPVSGVIATDTSPGALSLAIENATLLGARERIGFRRGSFLEPLLEDVVDAVVSNPPYITSGELDSLDREVRDFEPLLALDGGPDGLGPTRRIAEQAGRFLAPGGLIALETDSRRAGAAAAVLTHAGFEQVEVRDDLYGRPRYVLGRRAENG
jgi:release factor glutamine methyltransferase